MLLKISDECMLLFLMFYNTFILFLEILFDFMCKCMNIFMFLVILTKHFMKRLKFNENTKSICSILHYFLDLCIRVYVKKFNLLYS